MPGIITETLKVKKYVLTFQRSVVAKSSTSPGQTSSQEPGTAADLRPSDSSDVSVSQLVYIIADVLHILKQVYQNKVARRVS